jgi:hypothetical protein
MPVRTTDALTPDMLRLVHETEARALARARDVVEQPESNATLMALREAMGVRNQAVLLASNVLRAYDRSADRIIENLKA